MSEQLMMSALLGQVLVAYTIECDNEFEHRVPHRTTTPEGVSGSGPWLISLAMWANLLRYVPAEGAPRPALEPLSRMTNLNGLRRWGYLRIDPAASGNPAEDRVSLTAAGRRAQQAWPQVVEDVDRRWANRFGDATIAELRAALRGLIVAPGPDYPPVVGYHDGMRTHIPSGPDFLAATGNAPPAPHLGADLSRPLLAFTVEYERQSRLSLTMQADVVRVIGTAGARIRDLPTGGGVSREGIAAAVGYLSRHELATISQDPAAVRLKRVDLTDLGRAALVSHRDRVVTLEQQWRTRYGDAPLERVRTALLDLRARTGRDGRLLLAAGLIPYPGSWRAQRPYLTRSTALLDDPTAGLPHHPMVLHRGGYPDGS